MVEKDSEFKVAQYGQWDGYIEGQGKTILEFLSSKNNINKLSESLTKVRFLDKKGKDKEFIESYDKNAPEWSNEPDNRTEEQKRWFLTYITRDLGAKILFNIINSIDKEIILVNNINFIKDSLMCEYAYNINLDKNQLEVYIGFQTEPDKSNRFGVDKDGDYYPVKLIKIYSFDDLPSLEIMKKECEPEEE